MSEQPVDLDMLIGHVERELGGAHPVAKLTRSVILSEQLGALGDRVVGHYVEQSRASGASWAEIGAALGVSKQAAQKRFVPKGDAPGLTGQFSRFTPRTREAVIRAQNLAREAGHDHVSVADLILAMIADPDTLATRCIERAGLSLADLRTALAGEARPAAEGGAAEPGAGEPAGHVPFSAEVKRVYAQSLAEALHLGHNYVGTEHVLLALLSDATGEGRVLADRGMTRDGATAFLTEAGIIPPA